MLHDRAAIFAITFRNINRRLRFEFDGPLVVGGKKEALPFPDRRVQLTFWVSEGRLSGTVGGGFCTDPKRFAVWMAFIVTPSLHVNEDDADEPIHRNFWFSCSFTALLCSGIRLEEDRADCFADSYSAGGGFGRRVFHSALEAAEI